MNLSLTALLVSAPFWPRTPLADDLIAFAWWRRHAAPIDRVAAAAPMIREAVRHERVERAKPRRLLRQVPLEHALVEMMRNTRITVAPKEPEMSPVFYLPEVDPDTMKVTGRPRIAHLAESERG